MFDHFLADPAEITDALVLLVLAIYAIAMIVMLRINKANQAAEFHRVRYLRQPGTKRWTDIGSYHGSRAANVMKRRDTT